MKNCPNCGAPIDGANTQCPSCGADIKDAFEEAPAQEETQQTNNYSGDSQNQQGSSFNAAAQNGGAQSQGSYNYGGFNANQYSAPFVDDSTLRKTASSYNTWTIISLIVSICSCSIIGIILSAIAKSRMSAIMSKTMPLDAGDEATLNSVKTFNIVTDVLIVAGIILGVVLKISGFYSRF